MKTPFYDGRTDTYFEHFSSQTEVAKMSRHVMRQNARSAKPVPGCSQANCWHSSWQRCARILDEWHKRWCEDLEAGGHTAVQTIPSLFAVDNPAEEGSFHHPHFTIRL